MTESQVDQRFDWAPDWFPAWFPRPTVSGGGSRGSEAPLPSETEPVANQPFTRREKTVIVSPRRDRTVNRKLRGIHIFMITVNATLGTGLYWRGGQILELGGPLAVLFSFLLIGILAWAVMQCITELLCIWPVPGALPLYVSEFIDVELGIVVGVAYWFTYSVSFAALIATSAAEIDFWKNGDTVFDGVVVYFLIPSVLIALNALGIEWYGAMEVAFGTTKIILYLIIAAVLIAINVGAGKNEVIGTKYWDDLGAYDKKAAQNWAVCLFMSLSISAFAYVGVEIVGASALEARWPGSSSDSKPEDRVATELSRRSNEQLLIGKTVKFSALYMPVLATVIYVVGGVLAAFDMPRDDCRLPRLSWIDYSSSSEKCSSPSPSHSGNDTATSSAFVAIAQESGLPGLANAFNVFLVFTALTCANTNLYVASRSLFGLTSRLDGGGVRGRGTRQLARRIAMGALAWLGRTNSHRVPIRAMIVSAFAFIWVPFLQLKPGGSNESTPIGQFIEVLAEMGSVGVIIVWACECWAFIRYYRCIFRHRDILERLEIAQVRRWDQDNYDDYPFRSKWQPGLAYAALGGCLFVLIVCNGAALWNGWHHMPFLSSFLIIFVFVALWVVLKLVRDASWSLVDLDNETRVVNKIKDLHDIRLGAS